MSSDCGRFPFYAVCRGHVPGVYRSWQECDQHVNGYRNSEHRDFRDLSEAVAWLCNAADPPARQPTRLIQPVRKKSSRLLEGAFYSIPSSQQVSFGVVVANSQHNGVGKVNSTDNNLLFGFTVFLPHNSKGLDLVAHGLLCYEERSTRQEILSTTGYAVRDYNYRVLGRLTEQFNQVNKEEVDRLNERIRSLELENENLRGQVEIFGKMLDE
ncbi:hypothetical protein Ahy_B10g104785 [Arachis hypogaea]|uniref:Ribonuclease H1 N-terminal domain-containing protein n=1 Tax=Arachis hypogaea TaxID=3818 RepID=A0A444X6I2_ARAHY|nr:hypothetical protein Ahy_B10g104785 [Arachis hypogaea]